MQRSFEPMRKQVEAWQRSELTDVTCIQSRIRTKKQCHSESWRIGQRRPVRVKFLCYEGTMQTACLRLMGKKLLVALTMEGKFAGEGLQNIDEDDDMLSAMARELVERNGIGETADAVWRALNTEHQKLFPRNSDSDHTPFDRCAGCLAGHSKRSSGPGRRSHREQFGKLFHGCPVYQDREARATLLSAPLPDPAQSAQK